jgi:hypothetical protein
VQAYRGCPINRKSIVRLLMQNRAMSRKAAAILNSDPPAASSAATHVTPLYSCSL